MVGGDDVEVEVAVKIGDGHAARVGADGEVGTIVVRRVARNVVEQYRDRVAGLVSGDHVDKAVAVEFGGDDGERLVADTVAQAAEEAAAAVILQAGDRADVLVGHD